MTSMSCHTRNYPVERQSVHSHVDPQVRRRIVVDTLLVVFWAAMIPGFMWMGSLLGY